jgi:hypothetical protein
MVYICIRDLPSLEKTTFTGSNCVLVVIMHGCLEAGIQNSKYEHRSAFPCPNRLTLRSPGFVTLTIGEPPSKYHTEFTPSPKCAGDVLNGCRNFGVTRSYVTQLQPLGQLTLMWFREVQSLQSLCHFIVRRVRLLISCKSFTEYCDTNAWTVNRCEV